MLEDKLSVSLGYKELLIASQWHQVSLGGYLITLARKSTEDFHLAERSYTVNTFYNLLTYGTCTIVGQLDLLYFPVSFAS